MPPALLGPGPDALHPVPEHPRIMFVRNLADLPDVEIGAHTYYDDPGGPEAFRRNTLYHFAFTGDRMMNGANHRLDGLTAYPFPVFGPDWRGRFAASWTSPAAATRWSATMCGSATTA